MNIIAVEPNVTSAFFSNNANLILAACVVVLGTAVVLLYKDNQKLQEKLAASQQARVDDAKEVNEKVAVPMELNSKVLDLIYRKLYDAKKDSSEAG